VKPERPAREHSGVRRLVVPLVLTVTVVGAAVAALSSSAGCGNDAPTVDAGRDAAPDVPIV
jgi:hypothetical protein